MNVKISFDDGFHILAKSGWTRGVEATYGKLELAEIGMLCSIAAETLVRGGDPLPAGEAQLRVELFPVEPLENIRHLLRRLRLKGLIRVEGDWLRVVPTLPDPAEWA